MQVQSEVKTQTFSGPIPPPQVLEQYNKIVPNAAERILKMAEDESAHRRSQDIMILNANMTAQARQLDISERQTKSIFKSDTIGQILGFLVCLAAISGSVYLAANNQPYVAAALTVLPLGAIIRALLPRLRATKQ